jgi:hypothetical protein
MKANTRRTFYYHADANALGGVLHRPLEQVISAPGSVALAQAGGFRAEKTERFDLEGLISFASSHVSVSGREFAEDGGWRSVATAAVEGLNVLNVVTAERIVAQISVMHFYDERPAEVSFNGSQFVNLRLNGEPVTPTFNRGLLICTGESNSDQGDAWQDNLPRFHDLLRNAEQQYNESAQTTAARALPPRFALTNPRQSLENKGSFVCSLVKEAAAHAPVTAFGYKLHLPDFGNIFLGEMRVNLFSAQLTMLRMEMGSVGNGDVSVGTAYSNGRPMP